jgi:hypothetical protein
MDRINLSEAEFKILKPLCPTLLTPQPILLNGKTGRNYQESEMIEGWFFKKFLFFKSLLKEVGF